MIQVSVVSEGLPDQYIPLCAWLGLRLVYTSVIWSTCSHLDRFLIAFRRQNAWCECFAVLGANILLKANRGVSILRNRSWVKSLISVWRAWPSNKTEVSHCHQRDGSLAGSRTTEPKNLWVLTNERREIDIHREHLRENGDDQRYSLLSFPSRSRKAWNFELNEPHEHSL
jgi:hypothetical protein